MQRTRRMEKDGEVEHGGPVPRRLGPPAAAVAAVLVLLGGGVEPGGLVSLGAFSDPIRPAAQQRAAKRGFGGGSDFKRDRRGILRRASSFLSIVPSSRDRGGSLGDRGDGVRGEEAGSDSRGHTRDGRRRRRQNSQELPPQVRHLAHGPRVQPVLGTEQIRLPVVTYPVVRHERLRRGQRVGVVVVKLVRQLAPAFPLVLGDIRR
mmetsp:Transcript_3631/g.16656  ORF Transcript_3631/g.16656 Transcript_3631/m.16656 type:complete len:205 (-) Transcript_3631:1362-1976(-)